MPDEPTVVDLLRDLTWDKIVADGIITLDEVDSMLRAKGLDPDALDYLYG